MLVNSGGYHLFRFFIEICSRAIEFSHNQMAQEATCLAGFQANHKSARSSEGPLCFSFKRVPFYYNRYYLIKLDSIGIGLLNVGNGAASSKVEPARQPGGSW